MTVVASGCTPGDKLSPDELISKVVAADPQVAPYEAEGKMRFYEDNKLTEDSTYLALYDPANGRVRYETKTKLKGELTISVNDGKQITFYQAAKKTATIGSAPKLDISRDNSLKGQTLRMIESVRKTHDLETLSNKKVAGRDTYHIRMTPKVEGTLYGKQELWIDTKTWHELKAIVENGNSRLESEITRFNDSPVITDDSFKLKLPSDVKVTRMEDQAANKKITLQEALKAVGKSFNYWNQKDMKLDSIELDILKGKPDRGEIIMNYMKDGVAYISLNIFPAPSTKDDNFGMMGVKSIEVRGHKGIYDERIGYIVWDEDGLRYSVLLAHPDLTLDEVLKLTETMQPAK
jgi:outer membrane lipoprotein-sorting protein